MTTSDMRNVRFPFIRIHTDKEASYSREATLLAYKAAGLPKKGRKFKDSTSR